MKKAVDKDSYLGMCRQDGGEKGNKGCPILDQLGKLNLAGPYIANDEMLIEGNQVTINSMGNASGSGWLHGIYVNVGFAHNYKIRNNTVLNNVQVFKPGWGIAMKSVNISSNGNEVSHNTVTGTSQHPFQCAVHLEATALHSFQVEACDNTVNKTDHDFHFAEADMDIQLRNNHINQHNIGLLINNATIGIQSGRGNKWSNAGSDCSVKAALTDFAPLMSAFIIPESGPGTDFFPHLSNISPDPSTTLWFFSNLSVQLDYCIGGSGGRQETMTSGRQLPGFSEQETAIINGTSLLSPAEKWDMARNIYLRILQNPALAPTGSPAGIFFSALEGAPEAAYATWEKQTEEAMQVSPSQEAALDQAYAGASAAFQQMEEFEKGLDFSLASTINPDFWSIKNGFLSIVASNMATAQSIENDIKSARSALLETAKNANQALVSTATWMDARKTLNNHQSNYYLHDASLGETYPDILNLAHQGKDLVGFAGSSAIHFFRDLDRNLFNQDKDGVGEEKAQQQRSNDAVNEASVLVRPNPSSGQFWIDLPKGFEGKFTVVNVLGSIVYSMDVETNLQVAEINLGTTSEGIYWVVFQSNIANNPAPVMIRVSH